MFPCVIGTVRFTIRTGSLVTGGCREGPVAHSNRRERSATNTTKLHKEGRPQAISNRKLCGINNAKHACVRACVRQGRLFVKVNEQVFIARLLVVHLHGVLLLLRLLRLEWRRCRRRRLPR